MKENIGWGNEESNLLEVELDGGRILLGNGRCNAPAKLEGSLERSSMTAHEEGIGIAVDNLEGRGEDKDADEEEGLGTSQPGSELT